MHQVELLPVEYSSLSLQNTNKGYGLFVFELNPRGEFALQQLGNARLEVQFDDELPEAVQVLVYGEFQSCIQVDQARAIVFMPI